MLPDYPELKRELRADLNLQMRLVVNMSAPLFSRIKSRHQSEGNGFTVETTEGKLVTKKFRQLTVKFEVPAGLTPEESYEQFMKKATEAARSMAREQSGILYSAIEEESAYKLDAGGKPFTPSMMWDMIEKMDLDFDENTGEPNMPTIHMHPETLKSIESKLAEWEADPDLRKRRYEVLKWKKEEWRDRESRRKLVG